MTLRCGRTRPEAVIDALWLVRNYTGRSARAERHSQKSELPERHAFEIVALVPSFCASARDMTNRP